MPAPSHDILAKIKSSAVGLDTEYELATGERRRRVYLDTTASALRLSVVQDTLDHFQPYYSNTHSVLHFGAKLSTSEYAWAHRMVLDFVNADPEHYTAFFVGSGTTGGMNRVARTLRQKRPERDVVVTSIMEHHSNDLPHRKSFPGNVVHVPAEFAKSSIGRVNMERLAETLAEYGERVNYVTITGVSNVTGIINPIHEIARLAHRYGALLVVDAAAMAAHLPIHTSGNADPADDLDVVVFSGHKVYAPGSPGVVVTRKDLFAGQEPQEVGGGMVEDVYTNRYTMLASFPDREEAGTPNICGAIGLAASLYALHRAGMEQIAAEECELITYALEGLARLDGLIIYGETDSSLCRRAGAISFNIRGLEHGLVAAILNDYFNISVRNECFCAHPYVREMITEVLAQEEDDLSDEEIEAMADLHRGMVRASFGIYSTRADADALVEALRQIVARSSEFQDLYTRLPGGDYVHKSFRFDPDTLFSVRGTVDRWLEA
ncbi:MAG: aminotransferase class V-fold PLP-dependent enzyme [Planctomycetes bacterium]|nr:aminotransferase class V-fold PLP-dependent enzyme [Planctomycetota bacterium]MCB9871354.1 aminotransferase class V-fold PLP-dependent enzyme [Planctomycetota bacterium]MCB9888608.1 aminotransferase class V-fold PLP-dependent enzyme [Planctomycetota bacterium]